MSESIDEGGSGATPLMTYDFPPFFCSRRSLDEFDRSFRRGEVAGPTSRFVAVIVRTTDPLMRRAPSSPDTTCSRSRRSRRRRTCSSCPRRGSTPRASGRSAASRTCTSSTTSCASDNDDELLMVTMYGVRYVGALPSGHRKNEVRALHSGANSREMRPSWMRHFCVISGATTRTPKPISARRSRWLAVSVP